MAIVEGHTDKVRHTRAHGLALAVVGTTVGLFATGGALSATHQQAGFTNYAGVLFALSAIGVGLALAWHLPRNPIGWLLLGIPGFVSAFVLCGEIASLLHRRHLVVAVGFEGLTQVLYYAFLFSAPLVLLLFPEGGLPSPRWRWPLRCYLGAATGVLLVTAAAAVTLAMAPHLRWSNAEQGPVPGPAPAFNIATVVLVLICLGLALAWVVSRVLGYRRATGVLRQQYKWLAVGAAGLVVALVASFVTPSGNGTEATLLNLVTDLAGAAFPVTVGVAVLRWRIYDIDRVVSRALSYAALTAAVIGVYVGMVALTTQALPFSSTVGVAASTLVAAALFAPLRRRLQRLVDRRFNRVRYDAERTVEEFAARLREAVGLDVVREDYLGTVDQAVQPSLLSLWVAGPVTVHAESRTP